MKKNLFGIILSIAVLFGLIPVSAFAGPKTDAAAKKLQAAQTAYDKAHAEREAADQALSAASNARDSADRDVREKHDAFVKAYNAWGDAVYMTKFVDIGQLQAAVDQAQAAYDEKSAEYNRGMYGFFRWQVENDINKADAARALEVLENGKYASYNHEGQAGDATRFENVLGMEALLNEGNALRENDDKHDASQTEFHQALRVTNITMAMAEANANVSQFTMAHMGQFIVAENLAWGYTDPYQGWYYGEKDLPEGQNGHYWNMTQDGIDLTGLGENTSTGAQFGNCYSQIFASSADPWKEGYSVPSYSVSEYFDLLREYIKEVDPSAEKAALEKAAKALKDGNATLDAADAAGEESEAARQVYIKAQDTQQKAAENLTAAQADAEEKASAEREAAAALQQAKEELEEAKKAEPTPTPTATPAPTKAPTKVPTKIPTNPSGGSKGETLRPTTAPSAKPTGTSSSGSKAETPNSTVAPTAKPTAVPTAAPTKTAKPTQAPIPSQKAEDRGDANPMYRLYNPNSGEHFYTASTVERDRLASYGWKYEGIGWYAPKEGNAVFRLYNPNAGDHHYTVSAAEAKHLAAVGWRYEGIGWYSDTSKSVPVYREYNPNAKAGAHNYTTSREEHNHLVSVGWRDENIGWYAVNYPDP